MPGRPGSKKGRCWTMKPTTNAGRLDRRYAKSRTCQMFEAAALLHVACDHDRMVPAGCTGVLGLVQQPCRSVEVLPVSICQHVRFINDNGHQLLQPMLLNQPADRHVGLLNATYCNAFSLQPCQSVSS